MLDFMGRRETKKETWILLLLPEELEATDEGRQQIRTTDEYFQKEFPELKFFIPQCVEGESIRKIALTNCIINVARCAELWLCGDEDPRMIMARSFAEAAGISVLQRSNMVQEYEQEAVA